MNPETAPPLPPPKVPPPTTPIPAATDPTLPWYEYAIKASKYIADHCGKSE